MAFAVQTALLNNQRLQPVVYSVTKTSFTPAGRAGNTTITHRCRNTKHMNDEKVKASFTSLSTVLSVTASPSATEERD
jgi:hypothetical protein